MTRPEPTFATVAPRLHRAHAQAQQVRRNAAFMREWACARGAVDRPEVPAEWEWARGTRLTALDTIDRELARLRGAL